MNRTVVLLASISVMALAGCDVAPYEAVATGKGDPLLYNRYTGKAFEIKNGVLTELPTLTTLERSKATQPRTLRLGSIVDLPAELTIKMKFVDQRLLYEVAISGPPAENLQSPKEGPPSKKQKDWREILEERRSKAFLATLTVILVDEDGFQLFEFPVTLNAMTRIVDGTGQTQRYEYQGDTETSFARFQQVNAASISWNF